MLVLYVSIKTVIFFSTIFFAFFVLCNSDAVNLDTVVYSKENMRKNDGPKNAYEDELPSENQEKPEKYILLSMENNDEPEKDTKLYSNDDATSSEASDDNDLIDSASRYISLEETSEEKRNKMEKPGMVTKILSKIGWDSTMSPSAEQKVKEAMQKRKEKLDEKKEIEKAKRLKYVKKGLPDINIKQYDENTYNLCSELIEQKEDELRNDLVPSCQMICLYRKVKWEDYSTNLDSRCKREKVSTTVSGLRRETGYADFVCYCQVSRYILAKYFQVRKILYSMYTEGVATNISTVPNLMHFLNSNLMEYRKRYISDRNARYRRKHWWRRFLINAQEEDSWLQSVIKYVPQVSKNPLTSIPILPKSKSR